MKYERIETGKFIERPNRFIAYVEIAGQKEIVHVKNTGRCKELLVSGNKVLLEKSDNPARKTAYDLVSVYKNNKLISNVAFSWQSENTDVVKVEDKNGVIGEGRHQRYVIDPARFMAKLDS